VRTLRSLAFRLVDHAKIAAEALRFRMSTLPHTLVDPDRFDLERAAACVVTRGDPVVDAAMRRLGTAWQRAGLDPERLAQPWDARDSRRLLASGGAEVIDALDDLARGITRQAAYI
jgi:hypothetical protein